MKMKMIKNIGWLENMVQIGSGSERELDDMRREDIQGKAQANKTHYEVVKKVRKTIFQQSLNQKKSGDLMFFYP